MSLIDEELTREQLDFLGPETIGRLLTAMRQDLDAWTNRLIAAWDAGDAETIRQARHAIKGVCSTFGADHLCEMAEAPMTSPDIRETFRALQDATLDVIRRTMAGM